MGFGPMFLGFLFLYDFQTGLRTPGSQEAYALLDLFPDPIGWLLLLVGLTALRKREASFGDLRNACFFFLGFSLLTFAKDTFFFSWFYTPQGVQNLAGELVDVCEHIFTLAFVWLLFRKTAKFVFRNGEDKLSRFHGIVPSLAVGEGILYGVSLLGRALFLPGTAKAIFTVLSRLDFIVWVCLIWVGAIALVRAMLRLSDL